MSTIVVSMYNQCQPMSINDIMNVFIFLIKYYAWGVGVSAIFMSNNQESMTFSEV